jgi:hypothetical protein
MDSPTPGLQLQDHNKIRLKTKKFPLLCVDNANTNTNTLIPPSIPLGCYDLQRSPHCIQAKKKRTVNQPQKKLRLLV